jgi:5'(3')-deoxyribonucleotidase
MTKNQPKPTLYLDMDGVLADFDTAVQQYLEASNAEVRRAEATGRWPDHEWRKIASIPNFYRNLPKMQGADQLMELALRFRDHLDYEVRILTAIPQGNDMPDAFHDKIDWIQEHYGSAGLRVHFGPYSHDKQRHCQSSDDILVDDRTSNCEEWSRAGGVAVQVKPGAYARALVELESIYHELIALSLI